MIAKVNITGANDWKELERAVGLEQKFEK